MMTVYPGTTQAQSHPIGSTTIRRFGLNSAVGVSHVMVDELGAAGPYMPSSTVSIEVISSDVNDTSAGTGARQVLITGIDSNWQITQAIATMNGTTAVAVAGTWFRVTNVEVISSGTYGPVSNLGSNIGNITVRVAGAGTSFVRINAGNGQSFSSHFCVPVGVTGYVSGADLSTDTGKTVDLRIWARDSANTVTAPYGPTQISKQFIGVTGLNHFDYSPAIEISGGTDVWITAKTASGTAAVSVDYWGWYV